jgi:hypothetical protein
MTEQDVFTRGEPMSCLTGHPVPRAKIVPPSRGFIPQRHSTLRSLPVLCTYHRYLSWGNAQVAPPGKTCSMTCHMSCLIDSTLTTHPRCTPRSPQVHYQVIGTLCLIRPHHSSTKHHITDIMRSKSKTVSSLRASSLSAGVQEKRLRQGNGSQEILPCNLSQFICIKVKH